jgi:hypothetical protein
MSELYRAAEDAGVNCWRDCDGWHFDARDSTTLFSARTVREALLLIAGYAAGRKQMLREVEEDARD